MDEPQPHQISTEAAGQNPSSEPVAAASLVPRVAPVAPNAQVLLGPLQPALWLPVTVLCTVLFISAVAAQYALVLTTDRDDLLKSPGEFLEHVTGRNLDMEEFADRRLGWEVLLDKLQGYEPGNLLRDAIEAYQDYSPKSAGLRPTRTLAILLAEAGRLDDADGELMLLEDEDSESAFVAAFRFAYGDDVSDAPLPPLDRVSTLVHPPWARDKLLLRIAEKKEDRSTADAARARLDARAQKLRDQSAPLISGPAFVMAAGVFILIAWTSIGCPNVQLGEGYTVSPWSVGRGAAVMVRAALAGLVLQTIVVYFLLDDFRFLHGFMSLIGIVPLLCFGSYFLLRPWGLTLSSCFGFSVPLRRWGGLLLFTIALAGVDNIGTIAISALTESLGVHMHWSESPDENFLWDPAWVVGLNFMDGVVWAPIFEEIGCRGFLYTTIRRWLPAVPAALATGMIFGAAHLYSLQGFLVVAWSGFLWSLAYEKTRSLLPGIFSHSLGNILAFGGMVLVYRV